MDQKRNDLRESFVDLLNDRRQPASSLTVIAEVADILEEHGNAQHLRCVVCAFQQAGDLDLDLKSKLDELASCSRKLGRRSPGSNSYAVRAVQELDEMMSRDDSSEELQCDPNDLGRIVLSDTLRGKRTWDSLEAYPAAFRKDFAILIKSAVLLRRMVLLYSRLRRSSAGPKEAGEPAGGAEDAQS